MLYIAVEVKKDHRCKNTTRTPNGGAASVNYKGKYEKAFLKVEGHCIRCHNPEGHPL